MAVGRRARARGQDAAPAARLRIARGAAAGQAEHRRSESEARLLGRRGASKPAPCATPVRYFDSRKVPAARRFVDIEALPALTTRAAERGLAVSLLTLRGS